uniref:Uncharacterized protein n=1 Tax=Odontella aurita TaxID=265563 RepID=A0A7S4M483_9STRA|mmetsp:Transcript_1001/g.2874  ORF Transcript_1001/g.2874 Transcript_1001/m.2874 type:complete len:768 (+) Transcript_1001:506-2809(+)
MPKHRQRATLGVAFRQNSAFNVRKGSYLSASRADQSRIADVEAKEDSRLDESSQNRDLLEKAAEEEKDQLERDPANLPGRDTSVSASIGTTELRSIAPVTCLSGQQETMEKEYADEEQQEVGVVWTSHPVVNRAEESEETPGGDEINNIDKSDDIDFDGPYDEVCEDSVGKHLTTPKLLDSSSGGVQNEKLDEQVADSVDKMGEQGGGGDALEQIHAVLSRNQAENIPKEDNDDCFQVRLRSPLAHTPSPAINIEHHAKVPNMIAAVGRLTDLDDSDCERETRPSPKQERSVWALEEQGLSLENLSTTELDGTNYIVHGDVLSTVPSASEYSRISSQVDSSEAAEGVVPENECMFRSVKPATEEEAIDDKETVCASLATSANDEKKTKADVTSSNRLKEDCIDGPPRPDTSLSEGVSASCCNQQLLKPISGVVKEESDDREDKSNSSGHWKPDANQSEGQTRTHKQTRSQPSGGEDALPCVEEELQPNAGDKVSEEDGGPDSPIVTPEGAMMILSLGSTSTHTSGGSGSMDTADAHREEKAESVAPGDRDAVILLNCCGGDGSCSDELSSPSSREGQDATEDIVTKAHTFFTTIETIRNLSSSSGVSSCGSGGTPVARSSSSLGRDSEDTQSRHNKSATFIINNDHNEVGSACTPTPNGNGDGCVDSMDPDRIKVKKGGNDGKIRRSRPCGSGPPRPEVPFSKGTADSWNKQILLQPIAGVVPERPYIRTDKNDRNLPKKPEQEGSGEEARVLEQTRPEDVIRPQHC